MEDIILEAKKLSMSLGKTEILHQIDLQVKRGEVYGLIGLNGAGKTTLFRTIGNFMKPTSGTVNWKTKLKYIGYMPQSCKFEDNATVKDTIQFFSILREAELKEGIQLCKQLQLDVKKKVKHLSPGQQKKLQMVIAITGNPDFYLLDEPTAGLDPKATYEMMRILKKLHADGKSILISSHILQDMDNICTNIGIMEQGRLIYDEPVEKGYRIKDIVQEQLHLNHKEAEENE